MNQEAASAECCSGICHHSTARASSLAAELDSSFPAGPEGHTRALYCAPSRHSGSTASEQTCAAGLVEAEWESTNEGPVCLQRAKRSPPATTCHSSGPEGVTRGMAGIAEGRADGFLERATESAIVAHTLVQALAWEAEAG